MTLFFNRLFAVSLLRLVWVVTALLGVMIGVAYRVWLFPVNVLDGLKAGHDAVKAGNTLPLELLRLREEAHAKTFVDRLGRIDVWTNMVLVKLLSHFPVEK